MCLQQPTFYIDRLVSYFRPVARKQRGNRFYFRPYVKPYLKLCTECYRLIAPYRIFVLCPAIEFSTQFLFLNFISLDS